MALKFLGTITVPQTTPARVVSTRTPCGSFYVEAHQANTTAVFLGDSTINATNGTGKRLEVPTSGPLPYWSVSGDFSANCNDLTDLYSVSTATGQKINIFYVEN